MALLLDDKNTVIPTNLASEYANADPGNVRELAERVFDMIEANVSRDRILQDVVNRQWSSDFASWIYSNVKAKGPALRFIQHPEDTYFLERDERNKKQKRLIERGWGFVFAGFLFSTISVVLRVTETSNAWAIALNALTLVCNVIGIGDIAEARRASRVLWGTLGIMLCGGIVPALYLTLRRGKDNDL